MKLWKIEQTDAHGWDTYDSAVVAAETEDAAKAIHPGEMEWKDSSYRTWASSPNLVMATYLGEAESNIESGVIVASFNAG